MKINYNEVVEVFQSKNYTIHFNHDSNVIKHQEPNGYTSETQYDEFGRDVYFIDSNGFEMWKGYDNKGRIVHIKTSNGYEEFRKYCLDGTTIREVINS